MSTEREIAVDYLARVEGEGAMYLKLRGDEVLDLKFKIFEPPRFFEAFLRGRSFKEVPDITARICGICPVAYQMSSCAAMEDAAGVRVDGPIRALRRLLYCGEWIESHVLHLYFLHAPDFLGYESAVAMAHDHQAIVERGLRLKRLGNRIMTLLGGREIHPINVKVGGFYRTPTRREFERDYEFVALRHEDEYAIHEGRVVSNRGLDIAVDEWPEHFEETHVAWSNALHAHIKERGAFHVGPMARYSLNSEQLTPVARMAAETAGLGPVCRNPFRSIVVRAVETVLAVEEALRLIAEYEQPSSPSIEVDPRSAVGHGATEAPRGLLYHRYLVDDAGAITDAHIVPPTSQNQLSIEDDLKVYASGHAALGDDELRWQLEQAIRNYDPCISCATHFLDLTVDREP
jgi:coenzyme F420-reducing hydrogenase alpha subunit